jgi:hypothetical protein
LRSIARRARGDEAGRARPNSARDRARRRRIARNNLDDCARKRVAEFWRMLTTLGDGYVVIVRCVMGNNEEERHAALDTGSEVELLFWQARDTTKRLWSPRCLPLLITEDEFVAKKKAKKAAKKKGAKKKK